jgi:hypothetical protein
MGHHVILNLRYTVGVYFPHIGGKAYSEPVDHVISDSQGSPKAVKLGEGQEYAVSEFL